VVVALGTSVFTLAWTHSVEKTIWEEDWRLTQAGLIIEEARIAGSGAGMEPPPGARFDGGLWRYTPSGLTPLPRLELHDSGFTPPWSIRAAGKTYATIPGETSVIQACP
jgi:hypothetical protein